MKALEKDYAVDKAYDPESFAGAVTMVKDELTKAGMAELPPDAALRFYATALTNHVKENLVALHATLPAAEWAKVKASVDAIVEGLARIDELETKFASAKEKLAAAGAVISGFTAGSLEQRIPLLPDTNAKITGNLDCTSLLTGKSVLGGQKIPFSVTYRKDPRFRVGAGVLVSTVERSKFSVEPKNENLGQGEVQTVGETEVFAHRIVETRQRPEAVPFSVFQIRATPVSKGWSLNVAPGVGINTNSGSSRGEFVLGGGPSWKKAMFFLGLHWSRQQRLRGDFMSDDPVIKGLSLPTEEFWKRGFSFGMTYAIK